MEKSEIETVCALRVEVKIPVQKNPRIGVCMCYHKNSLYVLDLSEKKL